MISVKPKQMQVKELVEILLKCDQEAYVSVGWCDEHWDDTDFDIYVGVEEYQETSGRTNVMIGSESYFNSEEEEDEDY